MWAKSFTSQKMYFLLCYTVSEIMRGLLIFLAWSRNILISQEINRRNPVEAVISSKDSKEIINLQFQLLHPLSLLVGSPCINVCLNILILKEKVIWDRGWWCLGRESDSKVNWVYLCEDSFTLPLHFVARYSQQPNYLFLQCSRKLIQMIIHCSLINISKNYQKYLSNFATVNIHN